MKLKTILTTLFAGVLAIMLSACATIPQRTNQGATPVLQNADTVYTQGTVNQAAPFAANLPTNIKVGDLLIIHIIDTQGLTFTAPSGWTIVRGTAGATEDAIWKYADGSEGATVSIPSNATASKWLTGAYRISGADTATPPSFGTRVNGTANSTSAPTGTVTAPWGAANNLFLALVEFVGSTSDLSWTGFGSGYTNTSQSHFVGLSMAAGGFVSSLATLATQNFTVNTASGSGVSSFAIPVAIKPRP